MKPKAALRHFLAIAGSSLLAMAFAHAATVNWDGDTSATWATAGNWDTAPANSLITDIVNFNLATYGGNPVFAPTVGTATSINGITIGALNGTMTLTNTAALSIGNSGIGIANGAGAFTISGSTTLGASQSWTNNSANLFTFGAVTAGANTLTIGGSGDATASGIISGTNGALTKEGAGILTLNAANTYTGATTVNGGELRWGIANAIAGGALNINNGGTVNIQTFTDTVGTVTLAQGGSITGTTGSLTTGSFISNNGGTMTGATLQLTTTTGITYNSTGPGSTTLQIEKITVGDGGSNTFNIADGNAAVDFDITGALNNFAGNNVGKTIVKTGAGVMQFSGSTTSAAGSNGVALNINEGTVLMNRGTGFTFIGGSAALITVGDGTGSAGSAILKFADTGGDNQLGTRSITINSDGLFDLNGKTQTGTGAVALNSTGQLDFNGGTLSVGAVTIVGTGAGANTTPIKNTAGSGSLTLTNFLSITPEAGYTTSLSLGGSGTLTLGGDVAFNAAGTGQAQITGSALSLGAANRIFTVGLGAGAGGDLLIDAQISASGARSLTKAGAGTLTLSNANSYTGGTTVSAGTLLLSGAFNMPGTGTLTVSNGGTFSLADGTARTTTGATTGSGLNLAAGSSLAFDWNGSSLDSFTTAGTATTVAGAVAIHINNTNPTGSGGTLITAASGLGTASYFLANNTNYTATISKTATTVSIGAQSAATALTNAYWLGGQVTGALGAMALSSGTTSNWASDASGTSASGVVPGGSAVNVIFGATGAAQQANVTTGAHMNLGSITFNDSAAVTIGGGNVITLNSTSGTAATTSGALAAVNAGSAITVTQYSSTTTNTNTINANLLLGANQTWNIAGGKTLVVSGQVGGGFGLTKGDAGTVTLTGTSTYSGTTTISAGTLRIGNNTTTGSLNINSAIVNNASLVFNRSNAVTQGTDFAAGISGTGSLTQAGSNTLTLSGTNTYQGGTFLNAGTLLTTADSNLGTGGGVTVTGNATWNMHPTNGVTVTYNRNLTINGGVTLNVASGNAGKTITGVLSGSGSLVNGVTTGFIFSNTGNTFTGTVNNGYQMVFASLGDSSNAINLSGSNSEFQWTGGAKTFALRPFTLNLPNASAGTTFAGRINNQGSGPITIQQNLAFSGANGARTLRLDGVAASGGNTFAGNIADYNGSSLVAIDKQGTSTWVLSGTNSYTGGTTVSGGRLVMTSPASLGNGALNVGANTFIYSPTSAGALNIGSGVLTLSGTIGTAVGGTASQSAITSTGTAVLSGTTGKVNIYGITGASPTAGVNNLITAAAGLDGGTFTLGTVYNNTDFTVSAISRSATAISTTVTAATPITAAYWKGGLTGNTGVWAASTGVTGGQSNWHTVASGGSNQPLTPGAAADLIFSSATSPGTMAGMTLGANMTVKTMTVNDTATAFGLTNDGYSLTITPGSSSSGITIGSGVQASTIAANVVLGANQTWTNNSTNALTVSGNISGSSVGLTKSGTGTIVLSGTNTYTGGTTVSTGRLLVNNTNGSGTGSGTVSVGASGTLGGTGAISGAVNVTGQLSPGASIETFATGTLSLLDTSTLVHELDSFVADAVGSDLLKVTGDLNLSGTVNLTLDDLAVTDVAFAVNDVFSLINYTGSWNNGLFTFGGELLSDEEVFSFGLNTWKISYDDAEGGLNFTGEYAGGTDSFVNITAVNPIPEPGTALLGGLGVLLIFRRRR